MREILIVCSVCSTAIRCVMSDVAADFYQTSGVQCICPRCTKLGVEKGIISKEMEDRGRKGMKAFVDLDRKSKS